MSRTSHPLCSQIEGVLLTLLVRRYKGFGTRGGVKLEASAKGGKSTQKSTETHLAERKIDVKLYTLYANHQEITLVPEFLFEVSELPIRFGDKPTAFLDFLRKWGRYVPVDVSFGGSVVISMKYETESSTKDINHGVEAALDAICFTRVTKFQGSASGGYEKNEGASNLMANSEISLLANGGDPQIAAAITDFVPDTHNTATFRGDLQAWLR